jgi:hypothetical protein
MPHPTATLFATIVNAADFKPLVGGQPFECSAATLSMSPNPQNGVTLSGTAPNQCVTVTAAVDLVFIFAAGPTNPDSYYPIGLALKSLIDGGEVLPEQRALFPTLVIDSAGVSLGRPSMTLTDLDNDPSDNNFDFLLMIQRASDGAIGIIDPKLTNT